MLRLKSAFFDKGTQDIIKNSYSILPIPAELEDCFQRINDFYYEIGKDEKKIFSLPDHTDGFLPFGSEYSADENNPDLCERFCYWSRNKALHQEFKLSTSNFYQEISRYERLVYVLARRLLDNIHDQFQAPLQPSIQASSYLQYCAYLPQYRPFNREFLEDLHEDGHLLSFIKPNSSGLMIMQNNKLEPLDVGKGTIAILAGSLLTALSDGEIPAMQHAVLSPIRETSRHSLMYFVNPGMNHDALTFRTKSPIHLQTLANARHKSFGNADLFQPIDI